MVDASFAHGEAGLGAILFSRQGSVIESASYFSIPDSVEWAELWAIKLGVSRAINYGLQSFQVLNVSLTLIRAFKQKLCQTGNFMVNFFFSVLDKVRSIELVEFMWIPRDFNVEAHNLSIRARQLKLMDCMLI